MNAPPWIYKTILLPWPPLFEMISPVVLPKESLFFIPGNNFKVLGIEIGLIITSLGMGVEKELTAARAPRTEFLN